MRVQNRRAISLRRPVYEQLRVRAAKENKTMSGITEDAVLGYLDPSKAKPSGTILNSLSLGTRIISDLRKSWGM